MGSKGKEKFTLFDVKDPNFGPYGTNNGVLLKNWNGASDNFALAKSAYPDQYKNYGMGVLDLHNKELMGTYEVKPIPNPAFSSYDGTFLDVNIIVKDNQKKYLQNKGISSNPLDPDFYNHVQQIPSVDTICDTQDVLRTFAGGTRSAYGPAHMSAPWTLGPFLSSDSINVLKEIAKYTTMGPDTDPIWPFAEIIFPGAGIEATVLSDNPAHLLASYFIRDFKLFDVFKTKPPSTAEIIGSFEQPDGNGTINFV